jgi:hypothetical protein
MTTLARIVTLKEAMALRECSKSAFGSLDVFLPAPQDRIRLGLMDGTPFRLVVKIGVDPHFEQAELERYKMGLWTRQYFRFGPHCRFCAQRIVDGEKALAFSFNPSADPDLWPEHWRKAFIHAGECNV